MALSGVAVRLEKKGVGGSALRPMSRGWGTAPLGPCRAGGREGAPLFEFGVDNTAGGRMGMRLQDHNSDANDES
jgi:hypothetical protein